MARREDIRIDSLEDDRESEQFNVHWMIVPQGRLKQKRPLSRPYGLPVVKRIFPAMNRLGYSRVSLRDDQDNP